MVKKIETADIATYRRLTPAQGARAYAELRHQVTKAGLLNRAYGYYLILTLFTTGGFFFSLYQFAKQQNFFYLLIWGTLITFFSVQLGGLVHDAGHRAVFTSNLNNDALGQIAAWFVAFRYSTWKSLHNAHHAHPNQEGDPDIGAPWIFTDERARQTKGLMSIFRKYQMWLYYPVGSFGILFTRFGSLGLYFKNLNTVKAIEVAGFLAGVGFWYILPLIIFPFGKALLFLVLTNNLASLYLTNIFAPNHKGMPQIGKNVKISFLEQQIVTARNIYGHWLTDFVYLSLNYQIEHHLFPNCPSNKLRLITPYVVRLCRKYGLPYSQVSIIESNRQILGELKENSS